VIDTQDFLSLERGLRLPGLAERLTRALASAADAERAAHLCADVLVATGDALAPRWSADGGHVVRVLATLCGAAPFLAPFLIRHPDWLQRLADDDLVTPRSAAAYAQRLDLELRGATEAAARDVLRRFKYYELARITVRDLWAAPDDVAATEVVLGELSHLADALLAAALERAAARVAVIAGPPHWTLPDGRPLATRFCVLAMGKLGGEELNYSSDVDLIYVLETSAAGGDAIHAAAPRAASPIEYYTRVAHEFGRLVTEATREGFLYRVDLDLRPEGQSGPLVVPSSMLAHYYDAWAATWEKAAFMKARPVAGDLAFGWQTIRAIDPMIYRSAMDYAGVAAIKAMKERIERAEGRAAATFNLKLGAGGIRDVEFVAQALQLLHGGRIPQVRGRSTQGALTALAQVGVLPRATCEALRAAYAFLRRAENRVQMEGERQTHRLPGDARSRTRLARAMGLRGADAGDAFDRALDAQRQRIRDIFAALFAEDGVQRLLDLFQRNAPHLLAHPATRGQIEQLAAHFAHAIEASPDPERAMNNLDRFSRGIGSRGFYYGLLVDRPELVDRLANLFAASEYLSGYMATHPRLIEPIFSDPTVLVLSRAALREALEQIRRDLAAEGRPDDRERELDALRRFHDRELVNIGLLDLAEKITPNQADAGLTDLAEVCVEAALDLARAELARHGAVPAGGEFLVVAMGKLASRELTYGSDLDVIFLYDVAEGDDTDLLAVQEYYVKLAQKLIWALQTRTADGLCYQIDARLRPSGNQGMLVSSLASFSSYHAGSAQVWERQALLRARPIAGGARLAEAFVAQRREVLARPLPAHVGAEIHRIRLRMETELAQETSRRRDFKTGRGGMLDIESVVQFLQLRHGGRHAELFTVDGLAVQLARLARLGLLAPDDAAVLQRGWEFLHRLSSRLRIVENRSISDLDEERGDLDGLARRLGYTSPQRAGGARRALLEDYRHHTADIRAVYDRVLGVSP
jgi:[glutamine synthetase] adenylyltransferase / [glutamine synthetase]-adenylyl-L-tyrosine phosphorylase